MALPLTVSLLSVPICGPFKSSAGNYYAIGDAGGGVLRAIKATDPSSSWATTASTTLASAIKVLSAFQVADVIHVAVGFGASASSTTYKYFTFNMAADTTFSSGETIDGAIDTRTNGPLDATACSIVVRSDGSVIVIYNKARTGVGFSRVGYKKRSTGGAWDAAATVVDGGAVSTNYVASKGSAVLGTSDRVHFIYRNNTNSATAHRSLTSADVLNANATLSTNTCLSLSWVKASDNQIYVATYDSSGSLARIFTFTSADTITATNVTFTQSDVPLALVTDGTIAYCIFRSTADADLYVRKSTDQGATWAASVSALVGTIASNTDNLSYGALSYPIAGVLVLPYFVDDGGTVKYNQYTLRSALSVLTATNLAAASPVLGTPLLKPIFKATALAAASPTLGTPVFNQKRVLTATALAGTGASFVIPALSQKHKLIATGKTTAAPVFGSAVFHAKHRLFATALSASAKVFGSPLLVQDWPDLILEDYVLDNGLAALASVNRIHVCDQNPVDYADVLAKTMGVISGVTFGAPAAFTGGRKATSTVIVGGALTGTGTVRRWAAVDSVGGRLLATGDLGSPKAVFGGLPWSMDQIVIRIPSLAS